VSINQHHRGQLYNHVVKKKLAEAAGYKSAWEWCGKHLVDLSQTALTMYGAVAEAFSEEVGRPVKALFPKVTTVEVQVRNIKGKAVVDFKGTPLEQVNRLTEVLTGELPPVPQVPLLEQLVPQA
jgi:hypothetical protein